VPKEIVTIPVDEDPLNAAFTRGLDVQTIIEDAIKVELRARGISPYEERPTSG